MSNLRSISRGLVAVAVAFIMLPAAHAGAIDARLAALDEVPQALALPAPFVCGSEWQGSTYPGHGSHNWNLDLNRTGDHSASDLGQPLLAQGAGTVVWFKQTGFNKGAGTYLEIDYGDVSVRYLHLVEGSIPDPLAEIGAAVKAGEVIGLLGDTGRVSGPHLHLEYWDSEGFDDTPWYGLPRANHLPVAFDGEEMIATPGRPTPPVRSTNCAGPSLRNEGAALWERMVEWYAVSPGSRWRGSAVTTVDRAR